MKINIILGEIRLTATLYDNEVARSIFKALPFDSGYQVWGDEIYFRIPVETSQEVERDVLETGELAFWPPGNAFCIFYGPTPVSVGDEPRAASDVIPFGKIEGDATVLGSANSARIVVDQWSK